uniref:Uncharacterized protein LOC100376195 n=1 Tax=Saccoglossus kowalevskii TaxID=10224 RepID=A0ABM0GID8_SACKO|nr:PREDICTED: uncharacterized protein LOC100376195 [Saccoglossus kowalevskii]
MYEEERQDEMGGGDADSQPDPHANKPEILKAKEFDNLSRMCLQQGNTQLALEYCGKATKIRQAVYGENHPETIKSLDLFTVIYADVGKKQYADAMKKFGIGESEDKEDSKVTGNKGSEESGLRYRGSQHKTEDSEVRQDNDSVPQEEYEPTSPEQERADDFVMTLLMMMVFFLITVFFALVMTYMYCHYAPKSEMCASIRSEVNYFYMRLKYHYYYYFKSNKGSTYM